MVVSSRKNTLSSSLSMSSKILHHEGQGAEVLDLTSKERRLRQLGHILHMYG